MRVIGVIDLAGGKAVHARRGDRARYAPVGVVADGAIDGDPIALARTYVDRLGLAELYAADLDAIVTAPTSQQLSGATATRSAHETVVASLAAVAPLWLDAGISSPARARQALSLGATRAVIGLETLESFDALSAICACAGTARVAFSLDLRGGVPVAPRLNVPSGEPADLAARAVAAGVSALIVLDLARVGVATGPDIELIAQLRASAPATTLIVGGGIRGLQDLFRLAEAGCNGALVATALHDGSLGAEDVRRLVHASESL